MVAGQERRAASRSVRGRGAVAGQQGQDVADGGFLAGGFGQREVGLDLVAVAAAVLVLDEAYQYILEIDC